MRACVCMVVVVAVRGVVVVVLVVLVVVVVVGSGVVAVYPRLWLNAHAPAPCPRLSQQANPLHACGTTHTLTPHPAATYLGMAWLAPSTRRSSTTW